MFMLSSRTIGNATRDEGSAVFPAEPPPWVPRALAWLLIALFAAALIAAIVVRVPETVRSRFVLVPEGGADAIQSPRSAVVEEVRVREGQSVRKGETLFVLRVDQVREWRAEIDERQQALRTAIDTSSNLEENHRAELRIKDGEIDQARREVVFRTEHLRIMGDLVTRAEKLATSGLIAEMELASHRLSLSESQKDLELARKTLAQKVLERGALETQRARQRLAERSAVEESRIRIASLEQPLAASSNDLLEVRAPYDAVCLKVVQQRVVGAGDELCQLTPATRRLHARLQLPESGLPRLAPRQRVRLFFDAFPYQRYGAVRGAIDWISPAAVARADGSDFIALASMEQGAIRAGGSAFPLKAGMQGEARITVGRRALIEYLFEPLRQARETLQP
jgi:membrane fusion protein